MTTNKIGVVDQYWKKRSLMMYYKYIDFMVQAFAADAKSLIDIGTADTQYIENFDWIPNKYALDIKNPYRSASVKSIEMDFLEYEPEEMFDFVTCLQVLEHIPNVEEFARKLLKISNRVLISVPYMWPEGSEDEHIHDPIDLDKVNNWVGREPSYHIIVEEPLRNSKVGKSKRLICYYQNEEISYGKALNNVEKFNRSLDMQIKEKTTTEFVINPAIEEKLEMFMEKQNDIIGLMTMEMRVMKLETELENKKRNNERAKSKISQYEKQLNDIKNKISNATKNQNYYQKEYNKILKSSSWRLTSPVRKLGKLLKSK